MNEEIKELIDQGLTYTRLTTIKPAAESTRADGEPEEQERFEISFSSEAPYERYFGMEILGHKAAEVRLEWLGSGNAPLLLDHDRTKQIGVIESAGLDQSRGKAIVRFSKSKLGREVRQDVLDGVRSNVSVGYRVHNMKLEKSAEGETETYRVTDWEPFETSIVSIPADTSVGSNRAKESKPTMKKEESMNTEEQKKHDDAIRAEAVKAEQVRVSEIRAEAKAHKLEDTADEAIKNGVSVEDFRKSALDALAKRQAPPPLADHSVQPSLNQREEKEVKKYSFIKAISEVAHGTGLSGLEAELHQEAVRENKALGMSTKGQLAIPLTVLQRDLTVTTEGADVVATGVDASFIGLLRNKMAVAGLGARVLTGLTGNLQFPKITAGASAAWEGENDAGSEQTQTIGQVSLTPNRVGCYTEISKQLVIQSTPDVEMMVRSDLSTAIALAIDAAAINGSGASNQPTGILNTNGIGAVAGGTDGAAPDFADLIDLESAVAVDNADIGALAYLTNAKVRGKLKQTAKVSSTDSVMVWGDGSTLNGYQAEVSNQVPSNLTKGSSGAVCSAILFGNWNDLMIGQWGGLDIVVDPYTLATTNLLRITVNTYADVAVRHAESFAAMQDALTT